MRHSNGRKGTVPLQSRQPTNPGTIHPASKDERLPDGLHDAVFCSRRTTDQGPRIELQLCKHGKRRIRINPRKLEVDPNRKPVSSGTNLIVEVRGGRIQKVYPKVSYTSPAKRKQAERRRNSRR